MGKQVFVTKKEKVWGQEVDVQIIPEGVSGIGNKILKDFYVESENDDFDEIVEAVENEKEYNEYIDEGIEPDSDDVRAIKEEIEKEQADLLFDNLED